jgi:Flp pilus assembly protein TadG
VPSLLRRLRRDSKGAVLAEFCIAIVPVLTTFFSFVQLSRIATARLVVKHSAIVGARAAAVITNGANNNPGQNQGANDDQVTNGVKAALGPWWTKSGGITSVNVTVNDTSSRSDPYNWVEVKVSATYACKVPMGFIACGGPTKRIEESYRMPHQGAIYEQ